MGFWGFVLCVSFGEVNVSPQHLALHIQGAPAVPAPLVNWCDGARQALLALREGRELPANPGPAGTTVERARPARPARPALLAQLAALEPAA